MQNRNLSRLPAHLQVFITDQNYQNYSPKDHAIWRYVMRKNIEFLENVAHSTYLEGLQKTGISVDKIPQIEEMNHILKKIGWAAVTVDGFIPPNAFMEFQAYNTLVIAADIRTVEHIDYTPAPDIIHEAAGHAPIIADPQYAEYLRRFGEIGSKAISSSKDYELYEAIRHLSIIKEDPNTSKMEILKAEKVIEEITSNMGEPSEMAQIRNLHWWTVEYGLIGTLKSYKIYGAGLLSSIGESKLCITDRVKKIPYSLNAAKYNFDITKPQPQLFVTPDFAHLSMVLEEFANTMALRTGGLNGIKKLIDSNNLGTIELSTGIQISGNFSNVFCDKNQQPVYFQTKGPTALSFRNKEIIGHNKEYHSQGFGSPIGKLKGINISIEDMSPADLEAYGIREGMTTRLHFEGNITVEGEIITGKRNLQGKIILISLKNCTVKKDQEILFDPNWGVYDMAVGTSVISAYSGVADPENFGFKFQAPSEKTHQIRYSKKDKELHQLYGRVRELRKEKLTDNNLTELQDIFLKVRDHFQTDWLLSLEIYEIFFSSDSDATKNIKEHLLHLAENKKITNLILDGLELIEKNSEPSSN